MQGVIDDERGTGHRFGHPKYSVAAKTGTAQVISQQKVAEDAHKKLQDHSLFIAFAPVKKPTIAIAVILENNPNAPLIARKVLDYYFAHQNKGSLNHAH